MRALISGITGQDGAYLAKCLLSKGYEVYGGYRRTSSVNTWRLLELGVLNDVALVPFDLLELPNLMRIVSKIKPDEVYNLAAQSFVGISFEHPLITHDINATGTLRLLEAVRSAAPEARFYQASTSEMFGRVQAIPQSESTPFYPRSPYGVAKLCAHWMTVNYREAHGLFACCGILFNHESPLRGREFVTRKISHGVASIALGLSDVLALGNLDARRDWGFAGEYVDAMWRMLHHTAADDYVVATGRTHTVREFVETAFAEVNIAVEWEGEGVEEIARNRRSGQVVVYVDPEFFRPSEVDLLIGNPGKAFRNLGWSAQISLEQLVRMMVRADLERLRPGSEYQSSRSAFLGSQRSHA
jgi:GDPmannose 4,6-dehydratase